MPARALLIFLLAAGLLRPVCAVTFEDLNATFGIPIWADDNLWDDEAAETAKRLGWPEESKTSTDSSFRKYPSAGELVLGARPYSLALYGEKNLAGAISMMFANKGDAVDSSPAEFLDAKGARERTKAIRDFKTAIVKDKRQIEGALAALLGQPAADKFGQGSQTRESVKRWDWNGHAILLAAPRDEYAAVRILPSAVADLQGKSRIPDVELRERLAARIERRPNGDVVLKDIPMVDQGPKGYCVPATWERVMRYMGVPADMYILAMAGDTDAGGGTSIQAIAAGAKEAISRGGRQLVFESGKTSTLNIRKCINRGLPVMWAVCVDRPFDLSLSARTREREQMSDPQTWKKQLGDARKAAKKIKKNPLAGHVRMIIGYNETTREIAFSDSWGPGFTERWMTEEEAEAISQGGYQFINF
ncbi:MAG: hypothetical protein WCS31_12620 [Verrucomicrobiae bacterium]